MIKLKEAKEKQQNANRLKNDLISLEDSIPELLKMEVGLNISTKASAYDVVLTSEFDDLKGLDKYRNHPEHVEILDFLKEVMESVAVVDYKLNQ